MSELDGVRLQLAALVELRQLGVAFSHTSSIERFFE
jgi:hypothetical protein